MIPFCPQMSLKITLNQEAMENTQLMIFLWSRWSRLCPQTSGSESSVVLIARNTSTEDDTSYRIHRYRNLIRCYGVGNVRELAKT
jgi:hypothetical protein